MGRLPLASWCSIWESRTLLHCSVRLEQLRLIARHCSYVLSSEASCNKLVKKSKFITHASPVDSFDSAMSYLDSVKDDKANHNCWAYRSAVASRCSDDGEPSGTAGRPILNILETENIVDAMIVVTRHFGGIKLGSGGLVRAYGGAAKSVVQIAGKTLVVPHTTVKLTIPSEDVGAVYNLLQNSLCKKVKEEYQSAPDGADAQLVSFILSIPVQQVDIFKQSIASICKGKEIIATDLPNI